MFNVRIVRRISSRVLFMITATALCIVVRDWYHQRSKNEQLSLQVRILAPEECRNCRTGARGFRSNE